MMRVLCLVWLCFAALLHGEEGKEKVLKEESVETHHSITINGQEIKYKAVTGTLQFKNEKDEAKASIFYVAYSKEGEPSLNRPISFCFNGGPGSAAVWLHMGIGPKRIVLKDEAIELPPYEVIDNAYSLLDVTDMVFIDPVSTGYSRELPGEDPKQFHGVESDIKSVGEFIRLYITRFNRWDSPKFLMGESYGTTRAAGLADYLHDDLQIYLNGIVLVSSVLDYQTLNPDGCNELPYILFLPSYTATAWHYKKLAPELQKDLKAALEEVEQFAMKEYALALLQGDLMTKEARDGIIRKLAYYTGLDPDFIDRTDLRICASQFSQELLRKEHERTGRFDGRFSGFNLTACGDSVRYDPSLERVMGIFTGAFHSYVRSDLKWESDATYKVLASVQPWDWGNASNKYLNVADNLRNVMIMNPSLRVYVASGYFDLATPYFATNYTFHHMGLNPSLKTNVTMGYYNEGHMVYLSEPSLKQFKSEVGDFYNKTLNKGS